MFSWFKYPFIRLLVPFLFGIYAAFSFEKIVLGRNQILVLLAFLSLSLLLLVLSSLCLKNYRHRWIFSVLLFSFLLLSGFSFVKVRSYKLFVNDISKIENVPAYFLARVCECPAVKDKSIKVMLNIYGYEYVDEVRTIDSKMIAYLEKDKNSLNLKYGDCIIILKSPEEVKKPPNPEQFDYKDYLYKRGVMHQIYLKYDAWVNLNHNESNPIYRFSYFIRDFLLSTMQKLGVEDDEYAVAAAILLGYDDSLPQELRQKYVAAGAMHILCVSGLHVGVIFMVFSYMLVFLDDRRKFQRVIKQLVLLVLIWFYALLAGLAPSILRATIMLSFVIIGNIINRKGVLLNSLAASAFILLCINPANLFDVGFLLSYTAVIGIVVLQNPIKRMFYFKRNIFNKIWEVTSVTIAAQIATAPFTIYYFHQFPIYFWLSNLFMTPVSSIVIIGGMIMLLIFFVPYINNIVALLVSKMIFVMNYGVSWIESLPYSIVKGIYINEMQFVILLLILLAVLFLVEIGSKKILFFTMIMSCLFLVVQFYILMKQNYQKEMVVYSINNMTALDFVSGRNHILVADSTFYEDAEAFSYNVENYLVSRGACNKGKCLLLSMEFDEIFVRKRKNIITFNQRSIALSDGSEIFKEKLNYRIPVDYMIVYGRKQQTLRSLLNAYKLDCLIIDGSVPYYYASKLMEEANNLGIKYHDVRGEGFFLIDMH